MWSTLKANTVAPLLLLDKGGNRHLVPEDHPYLGSLQKNIQNVHKDYIRFLCHLQPFKDSHTHNRWGIILIILVLPEKGTGRVVHTFLDFHAELGKLVTLLVT